jgi:hypothetical protein
VAEKLPISLVTVSLLRHVVLSGLVATARRRLRGRDAETLGNGHVTRILMG